MKSLIKISLLAILISMLSSCAIHSGYMNSSASLSEANFSYIQHSISGSSRATKVFGIGGIGKDDLVNIAKKDMLKDYKLKDNQALTNVTVDWKIASIIVVQRRKCTITADIVEFK